MTLTPEERAGLRERHEIAESGRQDAEHPLGDPPAYWCRIHGVHAHEDRGKLLDHADAADQTIARLEGRACLICGRPEPCSETPEACTFDPSPIKAAQEFQRNLHAARKTIASLEARIGELEGESRAWRGATSAFLPGEGFSGLSTAGINVVGDRASIDRVASALHSQAQIEEWRSGFKQQEEAFKADNARIRAEIEEMCEDWKEYRDASYLENARLRERIAVLEKALAPFAEYGRKWTWRTEPFQWKGQEYPADASAVIVSAIELAYNPDALTLGDFRRALHLDAPDSAQGSLEGAARDGRPVADARATDDQQHDPA